MGYVRFPSPHHIIYELYLQLNLPFFLIDFFKDHRLVHLRHIWMYRGYIHGHCWLRGWLYWVDCLWCVFLLSFFLLRGLDLSPYSLSLMRVYGSLRHFPRSFCALPVWNHPLTRLWNSDHRMLRSHRRLHHWLFVLRVRPSSPSKTSKKDTKLTVRIGESSRRLQDIVFLRTYSFVLDPEARHDNSHTLLPSKI